MLIRLSKPLNLANKLLILLALDANRDSESAQRKYRSWAAILRNSLKIGDFEVHNRLLEDIEEVLGHHPIQLLEIPKPLNPIIRGLGSRSTCAAKVRVISVETAPSVSSDPGQFIDNAGVR